MFIVRSVIYFRMDLIVMLLPVADVYISASNDPDSRAQCGYEVNILFLISSFRHVVTVIRFPHRDSIPGPSSP
jgi:hypothetical protein